jgi:hypothetical protein
MAGNLVTVATFDQTAQAHIARGALEAAGIQVAVNNEQTSSLFGGFTTALGGIRLVVREEDEEQAVQVLDDTFATGTVGDEELAALAEAALAEDPVEAGAGAAPAADPAADQVARERRRGRHSSPHVPAWCSRLQRSFATVMILQAANGPGELTARGRRHLYAACLLVLVPFVLIALAILIVLGLDLS